MSQVPLTAGVGTFALLAEPDVPHNGRSYLTVEKDAAEAYIYHPFTGKPEASDLGTAIVRLFTDGAWGLTGTVELQAAGGFWTGSGLTWNASPGVTGSAVSVTQASNVDADEWAFTMTTEAALMLLNGNFGFRVVRTDAGASKAFYGFGSAHPPSLELTWDVTPTPPSTGKPSGGRAVATSKPPLAFPVGEDCTHIQVQVAADGDFSTPDFDSGMFASTVGKFYLEGSAYSGVVSGFDVQWRAQWWGASGVPSGFGPVFHFTYRAYMTAGFTYPSDAGGGIVNSDDPTLLWDVSAGIQTGYQVTVADAVTPLVTAADSKRQSGTGSAWAIPQGAILDSSMKVATLKLTDDVDREAVEGFPVELVITQEFQYQPTAAIPPPATFTATPIGTSSFNLLEWTWIPGQNPDSWQVRRNEGIIFGAAETRDLRPDAFGVYRIIDYTGPGNSVLHYRVGAKVGGKVSSGGPTQDVITRPKGKYLGDPANQDWVLLGGQDLDNWDMGEVSAMYYPLRGSDAVQVTQSQRGYEGPVTGDIRTRDGVSAGEYYNALMRMRRNPDAQYVVAYPFVAFFATFRQIKANLVSSVAERWQVELQMAQQGSVVWLHGQTWLGSSSTLLAEHDYEEGTDGATLTTSTDIGALATGGAAGWPKYEADEAIHGDMGFQIPATAGGGWVEYEIPYNFAFSIYLTPRSSSGSGALAQLRPVFGAGTCCEFTLRSGGDLSISDEADHTVDGSKTHGVYGWTVDKPMRVDGLGVWDNGVATVAMRIFTSPEANNPSDEVQVTFPMTSAPGVLRVGNGTGSKHTGYDSVRIYAGSSTWPSPLVPDTTEVLYSIPGGVAQTGATVKSRLLNATTIDLAVGTSLTAGGDPATPTYYGPSNDGEVDANGLIQHDIADQAAGTTYYAKLSTGPGGFVGDLMQWTTLPAVGAAYTRKIAIVSCQRNFANSQTQLGWTDMLAWGPNKVLLIGDADYQGGQYDPTTPWQTMLEAYTAQLTGLPAMRQQLARAETVILEDDHAFSANNGDSNDSTDTGKVRATNILALQEAFPLHSLADDRAKASKRSLSGSVMLGKTVRLIYLDSESLDRSVSTVTDGGAKTFLGSEGDAFLRGELVKPAALNIIICPKALLGDEAHGTPDADQVWNYNTWRTSLAAFINSTLTTDGKTIFTYWFGGDRHANAYVTKAGNPIMPGHPALISSGIEQFALDQRAGEEDYTNSYGYGDHTLNIPRVQYMQVTITDTPTSGGAGGITVAIKSRESENTFSGSTQTDPTTWTMVDGFTASDSWSYTAAPGDVQGTWAGDAEQTTCKVTGLFAGATSVSLLWANNPGMTGATTVAGGAPDGTGFRKFAVTGLTAGQKYYYRYLDTFTGHFTDSPIGEVYSFNTLKAAGAGTMTTKIAVGSCGQTAPMNGAVWADILAWGPDRVQHLGDFGYPGYLNSSQTTHKQNWADNLQDQGIQSVAEICCLDYMISDHDVNGHHHESNAANFHDAISQANMDAWVAVVPARVVDVRSPVRARYRSEVEGKVRFIKLDTRSWDRTDVRENGVLPTNPTSTMLGATQLPWLQAEIVAAQAAGQVVVLFTDPAWNGEIVDGFGLEAGSITASYSDKWPAYQVERDAISDYAAAHGVDLFIAFGDSHGLQQDDGTNEKNGFATICCGPWDQNPHMHFQDSYQWSYPAGVDEGGGKQPQIQQYQRLTVSQTPTQVTIKAEAMDCTAPATGTIVATLTKTYSV